MRAVIGIEYDEKAYYDEAKPSGDTYNGVYVFINRSQVPEQVFNTGNPVADFDSAREYARERTDDIYLSSTVDFFPVHSDGHYVQTTGPDGYRTIAEASHV